MAQVLAIGQTLAWDDAELGETLATVHTNGADARCIAMMINAHADLTAATECALAALTQNDIALAVRVLRDALTE